MGLVTILVSHSNQQQSSLPAIDCYLPNDLVKTLIEQFLSDWAKTNLSGLSIDQSFIKLFMELNDLYFGGWSGEDSLYPELSVVGSVFFGR